MKGVSIAIETIIYLIIAIMVMTVLIFFFMSQATPVENTFQWTQDQTRLCGQYLKLDSVCAGDGSGGLKPGTDTLVSTLVGVCAKLNTKDCLPGGLNKLNCIQNCCIICPVRPRS
ncbi:MAG: hypothetical protein NT120_00055 [Candidatus Aenigmarchaeota archaeon]|nr:hypothetical protein [Candidatus Aenigmarchaeota archaeon]